MDFIATAPLAGYAWILNSINRIKNLDIVIGVALINTDKKYVAVVTAKLFVCRLQIWRIRLTATSSC